MTSIPVWSTTKTKTALTNAVIPTIDIPAQSGLVVVNPDGSHIFSGGITIGAVQLQDGAGNPITSTAGGTSQALDVRLAVSNTQRFYVEASVTDVDLAIAFGFTANNIVISNDDLANAAFWNYGAAAVADVSHDKVLAGETFSDDFEATGIHLICAAGKTATVRIWSRG